MRSSRIAADCTLPPARVLPAAYDFGPDRTLVWPAVRAEHLTVHELSETTADATEGTPAGIGTAGVSGTPWTTTAVMLPILSPRRLPKALDHHPAVQRDDLLGLAGPVHEGRQVLPVVHGQPPVLDHSGR
jgi:hypothetical protein